MTRARFSYRDDPSVPAFADDQPIPVFDGECALCLATVQFAVRHDRRRQLRPANRQSRRR